MFVDPFGEIVAAGPGKSEVGFFYFKFIWKRRLKWTREKFNARKMEWKKKKTEVELDANEMC